MIDIWDIKKDMKNNGITQKDIAEKLGKAQSTICSALDPNNNTGIKTLNDIINAISQLKETK